MDTTLDTAPCGFLAFTDDGRITGVNSTLAQLLNYSKDEIAPLKFESLLTIAGRIFYQTHFFPLLQMDLKAEEIFLTLKGKDIDVPVLLNAVRKKESDSFINQCILMPVYQRRKYEDEILKAKKDAEDVLHKNEILIKLKEELEDHKTTLDRKVTRLEQMNNELVQISSIISHDLQEPIRKISMFADMIQQLNTNVLSVPDIAMLEKIKNNCLRLRNLSYNLDQLATAGEPVRKTLVDMPTLLKRARQRAEKDEEYVSIEVTQEPIPPIEGDNEQLELLFYSLFHNAIKFRSPDTPLAVHIAHTLVKENSYKNTKGKYNYTEHIKLTFCDNGIGFENEYKEYVFKMFKKIKPQAEGSGFGLALSRKIADNHNGTITCDSEPGKGTCFYITLPLHQ